MSKIQSIHINNFKFFGDSEPIRLEGKHLLMYGENGSGKSSFCYALYTLLEAAGKRPEQVRKYFVDLQSDDESLLNIHADYTNGAEGTNAYVEVEDTNGTNYRLGYSDTAVCGNPTLTESLRASDYVDYKSLLSYQLFRNSQEVNLKNIFEQTILPYISFDMFTLYGKNVSIAMDMWKVYQEGPAWTKNRKEKPILVYKNSREYREYLDFESHFNRQMKKMVTAINMNVENMLKRLGYDFRPKLTYENAKHKKFDKRIEITPYKILLSLDRYDGKEVEIKHPSTFLNEAKMAALAFSIRWSVFSVLRLKSDVVPDAMKVLVLDDLMISLDMGNREKMLPVILRDLTNEFQVLFLTHDRNLFETVKKRIENNVDWLVLETYDVVRNGIHQPIVMRGESSYAKALRYFHGAGCPIDYCAAGNSLRQAMEERLKELLISIHASVDDKSEKLIRSETRIELHTLIDIARREFPRCHFSLAPIEALDELREFVLNPASHYSPTSNFYKAELDTAFAVYEELKKCQIKIIVPQDKEISVTIGAKGGSHVFRLKTFKEIMASRCDDVNDFQLLIDKYKIGAVDFDGQAYKYTYSGSLQEIYDALVNGMKIQKYEDIDNHREHILDVVEYDGCRLSQLIKS